MINVYKIFSRDFSWKHPIRNIKYIFKSFKWSRQRAKYGYCGYDLGDVYAWFAELMPRMIRDLKENYIKMTMTSPSSIKVGDKTHHQLQLITPMSLSTIKTIVRTSKIPSPDELL